LLTGEAGRDWLRPGNAKTEEFLGWWLKGKGVVAFVARGQRASLWRRRQAQKLAPLGCLRQKEAPSGGSKRPPSPGGPPPTMPARAQQHRGVRFCQGPRQPEQNSTAGFAFTGRARWQPDGATARRRALQHGATSTARAQQHGGARFHRAAMAPRQQLSLLAQQHVGTCFCRSGHDS